jgi:hypothetical protein
MGEHSLYEEPTERISMLTSAFWLGALDRAGKTFAQSLVTLWGADQAFNLLQIDLVPALGVAAGAAVLSVLTSLASAPVGGEGTSMLRGAK